MMITVDANGQTCPKPMILTKRALNEAGGGDQLEILIDNETSFQNLMTYLGDQGCGPVSSEVSPGAWKIEATKPADNERAETTPGTPAGYVVVVGSEALGQGDDDLGRELALAFLEALSEQDPLPTHVVFFNAGVKHCQTGSAATPFLEAMQKHGVKILVSKKCANHFKVADSLAAGEIWGMCMITELLATAPRVVKP